MDQFLKKHKLPQLNPNEIEHLNSLQLLKKYHICD